MENLEIKKNPFKKFTDEWNEYDIAAENSIKDFIQEFKALLINGKSGGYVIVSPDMETPGNFRLTWFNRKNQPCSHEVLKLENLVENIHKSMIIYSLTRMEKN